MKFRNFFLLFRIICFVLPDPDSKYGSGSTDLTSKHEISYFFLLLWVIFFVLPDPDSKYGSRSTDLIESRSNTDPDPQHGIFFRHAVGTREGDSSILLGTESFNQLYRKSKGRTSCLHRINIRGKLRASNMASHHCRSRLVHRNWRRPAVLWNRAQNSLYTISFQRSLTFPGSIHIFSVVY
jgi:hypothetical protein